MATAVVASAGRARPEGGGIIWHARVNLFECQACGGLTPMGRGAANDPERLAVMREMLVIDHAVCWEYSDRRMAQLARHFRKACRRHLNLAAQRVGWKGGRA
jgi:hypothetical protein